MKVTARRTGGPLRCEIAVGSHVIVTDEPLSLGGRDTAPTPHQLLPAALAGCVATMIQLYASRNGWELGAMEVMVDYDPAVQPRRFDVQIRIAAPLSVVQLQRLEKVAQTCPVRRALSSDVEVVDHIVVDTRRAA